MPATRCLFFFKYTHMHLCVQVYTCTCVCGGYPSFFLLFFETGFSLNLELTSLAGLTGSTCLSPSAYPAPRPLLELQILCSAQLYLGVRDPESGPHSCISCTLQAEPSLCLGFSLKIRFLCVIQASLELELKGQPGFKLIIPKGWDYRFTRPPPS